VLLGAGISKTNLHTNLGLPTKNSGNIQGIGRRIMDRNIWNLKRSRIADTNTITTINKLLKEPKFTFELPHQFCTTYIHGRILGMNIRRTHIRNSRPRRKYRHDSIVKKNHGMVKIYYFEKDRLKAYKKVKEYLETINNRELQPPHRRSLGIAICDGLYQRQHGRNKHYKNAGVVGVDHG